MKINKTEIFESNPKSPTNRTMQILLERNPSQKIPDGENEEMFSFPLFSVERVGLRPYKYIN